MSDAQSTDRFPIPPASFTMIVLSLRAQAEMQFGLLHFGDLEKPEPDLDLTRHTIDLMATLVQKTKGNLTLEAQRLIDNSLTELRFRFVHTSGDVSRTAAAKLDA